MVDLLEYIIEECSNRYLEMNIQEWVVKRLIMKSELNTNKLILRRLCGRYITLIMNSNKEDGDSDDEGISSSYDESGMLSVLNQGKLN